MKTRIEHTPFLAYVGAFAALLCLTALTFGLSFANLGPWGAPVGIAIAGSKAVIITLVFMHLIEQQASPRLVVLSALSLAMLLIGLVALDAATRDPEAPLPDLPKSGIDQARSRSS